ncbi:MAG TPA: type VI secretion system baseplate subunit TssF [Bryobacteraceae bacterium]|jgi:type VI secretion system protein ImpG|nr:type VI secretion system baseplate subunit TssF [Bryobacteraceae bacterium]
MRSDLLPYYENELSALRRLGGEFADKYPKIASRLQLEPNKCEDPHVERLLEGFAFLAARIQLRLDDEFPLITESLLEVLYPDFLRPIPSTSIAEFQMDAESGSVTTPITVKRGAKLYSRPVNGVPCKFRTSYDLNLLPLSISKAEWVTADRVPSGMRQADCAGAIRIDLRGPHGVPISSLDVDQLRFFLDGEAALTHALYEMLHCNLLRVGVRAKTVATLHASSVTPVGFEEDEAMLAYSQRSFTGYRLLQEYFAFPDKFLFFDVKGCRNAWLAAGADQSAEIYFLFPHSALRDRQQRLEAGVSARTFRLNCTPVINLFEQTCEPILLDQRTPEYALTPDIRRPQAVEIYSIEQVAIASPGSRELIHCEPFYAPHIQAATSGGSPERYFVSYRRPSNQPQDAGMDVVISLVDSSRKPCEPSNDTLNIRTICTNRDLPSRLPFGNAQGDFELEGNVPVSRIVALRKPTPSLRPLGGPGSLWNLVSLLSLNHLSLVEQGKPALQTLLQLCDYTPATHRHRFLEGIAGIRSEPHFAGLPSEHGITFARGTRVELQLDEEKFVGRGVYLFSAVLERFFALYCSLNSFSQLTATVLQRGEVLRQWNPRAGQRLLM